MKYAIYSNLCENAIDERGIGGDGECVMVFESREDALKYAETLIRNGVTRLPTEYDIDEAGGWLDWFQEGLNTWEDFSIIQVVEG